jgi:hypothetical protein
MDLLPTLAGGLFAHSGGPGRVDRSPAGAVGTNLGESLVAQIRPQVPPVADLHRIRQSASNRLAMGARSVAADDLDPGVASQPGLQDVGTAAGQHVNPLAGLGVGEDGGVTVAALENEVIDTQHARDPQRWQRQPHEQAQCRGPGDRDSQDRREPSPCPAGQLCDHGTQLARKPTSSTLVALEQPGHLLTKRLPTTFPSRAEQTPSLYRRHHPPTVDGEIGHCPAVVAVHPPGQRPSHPGTVPAHRASGP